MIPTAVAVSWVDLQRPQCIFLYSAQFCLSLSLIFDAGHIVFIKPLVDLFLPKNQCFPTLVAGTLPSLHNLHRVLMGILRYSATSCGFIIASLFFIFSSESIEHVSEYSDKSTQLMYIHANLMPLLKRTVILSENDEKDLIIIGYIKSLIGKVRKVKVRLRVNMAGVRHFFVVLD